jgi:uncharacterized protein DUF2442
VTNVTRHGLWILLFGGEKYLSFDDFPWFLDAPIGAVLDVKLESPGHLRWPRLDVDVDVASIDDPERFPLVSRHADPSKVRKPARTRRSRASARAVRR